MEPRGETSEFRVSLWRRAGYPLAGLLFLAVALIRWLAAGDMLPIRVCALVVPGTLLMTLYLHRIILLIDVRGISLRWPLLRNKHLEWNSISQVRRSDAPPGRNFYIDLIVSPDLSLQFNPFLFEKPHDIINELNRRLKFDMLGEDAAPEEAPPGGIAVAADSPGISRANWILIAVFVLLLVLSLVFFLK